MLERKRRGLSPTELTFVITAFKTIDQNRLNYYQLKIFLSIRSQFELDGKLSNKQLDTLERLHRTATRGVYGTAESDSDRLNAKLNIVFNPMKNGRKR